MKAFLLNAVEIIVINNFNPLLGTKDGFVDAFILM